MVQQLPERTSRLGASAASAANGVVDTVKSLVNPTPEGDWTSVCVCSDGLWHR